MTTEKTIGILAGMGPHSTAPFIDLIITQCQIQYGVKHACPVDTQEHQIWRLGCMQESPRRYGLETPP